MDGWRRRWRRKTEGGKLAQRTRMNFVTPPKGIKLGKHRIGKGDRPGLMYPLHARTVSARQARACGVNETRLIIAKTGQRQFAEEGRKAEESCALFGAVGILQIHPFTQSVVAFPERNSVPSSHPLPSRMISVKLEFPVRTRSSN